MGRPVIALALRRLVWFVPSFIAITFVSFVVAHLAPGDPLHLEDEATSAQVATAIAAELELDRPIVARYVTWLGRCVRLDLGRSVVDRQLVTSRIAAALPRTLVISGAALALAVALSVGLGTALAVRRRSRWATLVSSTLVIGSAVPAYWVAVLAMLWLATPHGVAVFPLQGFAPAGAGLAVGAWHLALPVLCLAWPTTVGLSRFVRDGVSGALDADFIRFGRARGLSEGRLVFRHAVPNALVPLVAVVGLHLPRVFAGSVVIERLFGVPGMGSLALDAIGTRDSPTSMGVTAVIAAVTLLAMAVTDLVAAWVDPRVLRSERA